THLPAARGQRVAPPARARRAKGLLKDLGGTSHPRRGFPLATKAEPDRTGWQLRKLREPDQLRGELLRAARKHTEAQPRMHRGDEDRHTVGPQSDPGAAASGT